MNEYEYNQPTIKLNQHFTWIITRPDGKEFEITNSEWLVKSYYSRGGWSYRRVD